MKAEADRAVYINASCDTGKSVTLSFEDAEGVTVTVNGTEYTADADGCIEIKISGATKISVKSENAGEIRFTSEIE